MKIDGNCHCGRITFDAEVDPDTVSICHCTDCQRLTGSAFRANIVTSSDHFALKTGTPKTYIKTAESGTKRTHAFCGDCGTPIYACAIENPRSYSLRLGTINQRSALRPHRQIWRRSALPWVDRFDGVPSAEKG